MKVEVKIDESVSEPKIIIVTDKMTEEINEIVRTISGTQPQMIAGFKGDTVTMLDKRDILRIYAANGKVYAVTASDEYVLRYRLYELEECLKRESFVRISNSEVVNLKKVKNFDLSFTGTICVTLTDGTVTYVSRRYVSRIKEVLGI
ncbi:response regulator [[Clostridium] cellulosi]|uniref:Response regulator n=2 Tax=Oscillospiraceae TaxID=216572 RepID=A0A078KS21_9FIRM|nr:MAG: LytTR family transcriptional regulator [[Clostridium] cellulosi]CDZ23915.1 response regulator [[Clostridium] cellulosi]